MIFNVLVVSLLVSINRDESDYDSPKLEYNPACEHTTSCDIEVAGLVCFLAEMTSPAHEGTQSVNRKRPSLHTECLGAIMRFEKKYS